MMHLMVDAQPRRARAARPPYAFRRLLATAAMAFPLVAAAAERDERAGHADERHALSAAHQSGRFVAWRLDRLDGRVSACLRPAADGQVVCSTWSTPATPAAAGPFAINAENSSPVGTLWVWRIDSESGRLDYCALPCCQDLASAVPACTPSAP
jgi:hypothetical protein